MDVGGSFLQVAKASAAGAVTRIAQFVLGSPSATVDFSSIPQTYQNLRLIITGACSTGGIDAGCLMTLNGDTGANYDIALQYNGGVSSTYGGTSADIGNISANTSPPNSSGVIDLLIPGYAGTTFNKQFQSLSSRRDATSTIYIVMTGGCWHNASAITDILLTAASGNFIAGSVFTLYGLN